MTLYETTQCAINYNRAHSPGRIVAELAYRLNTIGAYTRVSRAA